MNGQNQKKDRQGHTGTTFMILGMRELKLAVIKLKMLHFWSIKPIHFFVNVKKSGTETD